MLETFPVDCSGLSEIILGQQGLAIESNLIALRALARRLDTPLPDNPRVLILGPGQFTPTTPNLITGPGLARLPELRDENDIIINLPDPELSTPALTAAMASALLLTKAEEKARGRKRTELITGLSVGALGIATTFVGYLGVHNRALELTGCGLVLAGTLVVAKPDKPAKVDLPDLSNIEAHPLRLVERLDELALEAAE